MKTYTINKYAEVEVQNNEFAVINLVTGIPVYDEDEKIKDFKSFQNAKNAAIEMGQHYSTIERKFY